MTESDFQAVCSLVSLSSLENVNIKTLKLNNSLSIKRIQCDARSHRPLLASSRENRGLRSIKLGELVCETESDFQAVCSLVSLPSLNRWNIESLKLDVVKDANPWKHLSKTSGCGSVKSFTVMGGVQDVSAWVREEVEAVKTSIGELCFEQEVVCSTNEEVKTLCIVLGLAQQWRVNRLSVLEDRMSVESWSELSKVVRKGTVDELQRVLVRSETTSTMSLTRKWIKSVEAVNEGHSSQAPLKSWTEEPKEAADQLPLELLDNEDVQDENVNTLNMTDRNSNQINSEFKRKLESLKEVCKTGAKTRSPGLERRKRKRRKERRQRKRATPLPADSSSEEETDSTVRPKKRRVPIRFELYPLIKGR